MEGFCDLITEKCNINFAGNIRTCVINCLTFCVLLKAGGWGKSHIRDPLVWSEILNGSVTV